MSKRQHRYRDFAPRIDIDAFLEATEILGVHEVKENRHGETELIGQCPDPWGLHNNGDTTGKFALNVDKKVYNCWVCAGGSLLDLTMAIFDMDPDDATDYLRQFAGDVREMSDDRFVSEMEALLAKLSPAKPEEEPLPYYNANILRKWSTTENEDALEDWNDGYLDGKKRSIDFDTLIACGVSFAPNAVKHAPRDKKTGMPLEDAYEGPAVIFPHFVGERLVGWQYRWLSEDRPKWVSKYTNTPDFPKRSTLFKPRQCPAGPLPVVIVESGPTSIFLSGIGWPSRATFGGSITPEQLKLLRRFQQGVIFAPDNDGAGLRSCVAAVDYLEDFIPVSVVLPEDHWAEKDDLLDRHIAGDDVDRLLRNAERIS